MVLASAHRKGLTGRALAGISTTARYAVVEGLECQDHAVLPILFRE